MFSRHRSDSDDKRRAGAGAWTPEESLLAQAGTLGLDCLGDPPTELRVKNLRRRGLDVFKISWSTQQAPRGPLSFLRAPTTTTWSVSFCDQMLRIEMASSVTESAVTTTVAAADISSIEVNSCGEICITTRGDHRSIRLGSGISPSATRWLRDRMVLEAAGLVWRPVHHVGKRTTRATANPDHQAYWRWTSGSHRLVQLFLEQAPDQVICLQAAALGGNMRALRQQAHGLKASCAAVGASVLSELMQRLEIAIDTADFGRVAALADQIDTEFSVVERTLRKLADGQGPAATADPDVANTALETDAPASGGRLQGARILLVDDSLVNQELAREYLTQAGARVAIAGDGRNAMQTFASGIFDLILMDCQMSDLDGFSTTRSIRAMESKLGRQRVPIAALTASALAGDRDRCLAAGMDDYLSKPFAENDLIALAEKWMHNAVPSSYGDPHEAIAVPLGV